MRLAPWLFGADPAGLGAFCGWQMRLVDEDDSVWEVQTTESVHGSPAKLIETTRLSSVGAPQDRDHYSRVIRLREFDGFHNPKHWQEIQDRDERAAGMRLDRGALLSSARNLAMGAPTADTLQDVLPQIAEHRLRPLFPDASIWLAETKLRLGHRYGIARSLLRTEEDQGALLTQQGSSFQSSQGLFSETSIGLNAYLDPLFTSLSPNVWGISAARAGGNVIYLLGELEGGAAGSGTRVLDLFTPRSSAQITIPHMETISPRTFPFVLRWWTERLNMVFAEATNLSNYVEQELFSPPMMVEKLINLEQVFRHSQSLATLGNDEHARRLVLTTALDAVSGINSFFSWDQVTNEPRVRNMLERIELKVPERVHAVLLPRARRAVDALREVQDGFFIADRRDGEKIRVRGKDGEVRAMPLHEAASLWLRVIRNSHHGFDSPTLRDRDLLVIHNGSIPRDLPDLAWVFVLYILCFPEVIRRRPPKGKRPAKSTRR